MPELTAIHLILATVAAVAGVVIGWLTRSSRANQEKLAIQTGWQEQLSARDAEHDRLAEQNKGLMTQISQFQASSKDAKMRSKELADALKEAFERRDQLQRELKDARTGLDKVRAERDQLRSMDEQRQARTSEVDSQLVDRDAHIAKLSRELENWQNRVPPLIERFNERNEEASRLETIVADLRARLMELEADMDARSASQPDPTQTRVEPVRDPDTLTDGQDASNEPIAFESHNGVNGQRLDGKQNGGDVPAFNSLRDDLKRIKGVGPAIEKTLNEMGIFRYNQIADMSEYDIDRIARRLKGLRSRIYREDWMGQARSLHQEKTAG